MKRIQFAFLFLLGGTVMAQNLEGLRPINGTSLYFETIGQGEPIVVVHGGPGMNHSYFMPHLNELAKKYKVVFYDQRASGKSVVPATDSITLKFFVEDIEAIRKELGVEKLNILAHSWGAVPAVSYGIRYPDKVKHLILSNPIPLNHEFAGEMLQGRQKNATYKDSTDRSLIIGSKDYRSGNPEAYRKLLLLSFRHSFYDPSNESKLQVEVPANYLVASKALYEGLAKDLADYDYYESLKTFSFPVLIIHGQYDGVPLSACTKAQAALPHCSLEVFHKSGHFAFIEQTKKFNSSVSSFLKEK